MLLNKWNRYWGQVNIISGRASPSYIIDGQSIVVVDVCFPSDARTILTFVRGILGRDITEIKLIVLTHSHVDHVNGVDYLVNKTGAAIAAHKNAEQYLTGQRAIPVPSLRELKEFLGFLWQHSFPRPAISEVLSMPWAGIPGIARGIRSRVTYWLEDKQALPDYPEWEVIHTPGHTDDSICLYSSQRKSLITGDTIINLRGKLTLNPLLELDRESLVHSLDTLKRLYVDNVYPGWGTPVLGNDILDRV